MTTSMNPQVDRRSFLRVTALAVSDGSVVSAVKVSNLNVELGDGSDLGTPDVGNPILVGVVV